MAAEPAIPLETAQRWITHQYLLNTPEQAPDMVKALAGRRLAHRQPGFTPAELACCRGLFGDVQLRA